MNSKKLKKWNNILHRDLGYFFVTMTLIYAISGIALNHINDWNPNYIIENKQFKTEIIGDKNSITKETILSSLEEMGYKDEFKSFYYPNNNRLKIFIENGSIETDLLTGNSKLESIKRRPLFYEINFLHYNPGKLWLWFADFYALGLIILAITGMFVLGGRKGIKGRGWKFVIAGTIIPILFLIFML